MPFYLSNPVVKRRVVSGEWRAESGEWRALFLPSIISGSHLTRVSVRSKKMTMALVSRHSVIPFSPSSLLGFFYLHFQLAAHMPTFTLQIFILDFKQE